MRPSTTYILPALNARWDWRPSTPVSKTSRTAGNILHYRRGETFPLCHFKVSHETGSKANIRFKCYFWPFVSLVYPPCERLMEETYTVDEVSDMLDGLQILVRGEVEMELINTAHTNVLLLRQLFSQAEKFYLRLQTDISELENRWGLHQDVKCQMLKSRQYGNLWFSLPLVLKEQSTP